jgi:type II restriction enzyme
MSAISAINIVRAIRNIPGLFNTDFNYINPRNIGLFRVISIDGLDGPIKIKRWWPSHKDEKKRTFSDAIIESISKGSLWRISNAISEGEPFNLDRILGASYNWRSVLETLIALTPQFYTCNPGRIENLGGKVSIKHGQKHLLWIPQEPHENGVITAKETQDMAVSEVPAKTIVYDSIVFPDSTLIADGMDIDVMRRHTQIQIALYLIGHQLGFRTWIANNDKGIVYKDKPLCQHEGIIPILESDTNIVTNNHATSLALLIDCIWFQNGKHMPAVMEVEHTTGVISGLDRMKGLYDAIPDFKTKYVIVAPDEDRDSVIDKINLPRYKCLEARYFPYSSVEELYYLCCHRGLHGVKPEFLDCYMEKVCV